MHCSYAPQVKSRQHLDILNFACRSISPISIEYAIPGLYTSIIQRDQPHQSASADQHGSPLSLHSAAASHSLPTISFSLPLCRASTQQQQQQHHLPLPPSALHPQPSSLSSPTISLDSLYTLSPLPSHSQLSTSTLCTPSPMLRR